MDTTKAIKMLGVMSVRARHHGDILLNAHGIPMPIIIIGIDVEGSNFVNPWWCASESRVFIFHAHSTVFVEMGYLCHA